MSKRKCPNNEILRKLYVDERKTGEEIASMYNVTRKNVYLALKKAGVEIRKPLKENHGMWKGGRVTCISGGYVGIHMPEHPSASKVGYVYEHTLVAEKMLGRSLNKDEVVHHIDLDKHNNTPENLFICNRKDHTTFHRSVDKLLKPLMDNGIIKFDNGTYILTI